MDFASTIRSDDRIARDLRSTVLSCHSNHADLGQRRDGIQEMNIHTKPLLKQRANTARSKHPESIVESSIH